MKNKYLKIFLRKSEQLLKKPINQYLKNNLNPVLISTQTQIFNQENIKKILLLRHDRLGDLVISNPFIKQLRKSFPDLKIDIVLSEKNFSGKRCIEKHIDGIFVKQRTVRSLFKIIRKINSSHFDMVIDLLENKSTTSDFLLKNINSQFKLGFDKANRSSYTHVVQLQSKKKNHPVERLYNLLLPFKIQVSNEIKLEYPLSEDEIIKSEELLGIKKEDFIRIGINLSGSAIERYWGSENFIKLINRIKDTDIRAEIVIFTTVGYKKALSEINISTNSIPAPFVNNLNLFVAMLNTCDFIITPDTSVIHISSALGIPCVALYSYDIDNDGIPWSPYKVPNRIINDPSGLTNITVESVFEAFNDLFNEISKK